MNLVRKPTNQIYFPMHLFYKWTIALALALFSMGSFAADPISTQPSKKGWDRNRTIWVIGADKDSDDILLIKGRAVDVYSQNLRKGFQQSGVPNFIISDRENNAVFGIGGFVALRMSYDWNNAIDNKDFYIVDIPMTRTLDNRQKFQMDAAASRLFFRSVVNTNNMGPIEAYIESDFRGGSNVFRLRQAYISFIGFTIGQAPTTFADLMAAPTTIDFQGPNGYTYQRNVMLRYHREFGKRWEFGVAIEMPSVSATPGQSAHVISQRVPDIPAYIQYSWDQKKSHVRLSGLFRSMNYADDVAQRTRHQIGWGVQFTTNVVISNHFRLFGQATYGEGIQGYIQDLKGKEADMVADPTQAGYLQTLPTMAIQAGMQVNFSPTWQVNAAYSQVNNWNKNDYFASNPAPAYKTGQYIVGNVFCHISPAFQVGVEYLHGIRKNINVPAGHANRAQVLIQYTF